MDIQGVSKERMEMKVMHASVVKFTEQGWVMWLCRSFVLHPVIIVRHSVIAVHFTLQVVQVQLQVKLEDCTVRSDKFGEISQTNAVRRFSILIREYI